MSYYRGDDSDMQVDAARDAALCDRAETEQVKPTAGFVQKAECSWCNEGLEPLSGICDDCFKRQSNSEQAARRVAAKGLTVEDEPSERCDRCGSNSAQPIHSCPYNSDINDDDSEICNCCESCIQDCADDR